ncbi:MAG: ATP-dependent sacrificial sulfur transferase LarE [Bacteroidales bacterium]|nr:MAG: ATP-dependent sacrificial sulfur transferase LarE [Bacteroidales bacterium]
MQEDMTKDEKLLKLKSILKDMGHVVVAFSGGVDSTFLLKVAHDVLNDNVFAVLATSPTYPSREYSKAMEIVRQIGAKLRVIRTRELEDITFNNNPVNRCYYCKSELFQKISELAKKDGFGNMVDGSNYDDRSDYRPGMKALKEKKVRSPLMEAGLTKKEIREFSKGMNLPTWEKDELACLSSRFPYGEKITAEKLNMVDMVENLLSDLGFRNIRARHSKNTIRIEVDPGQIYKFFDRDLRNRILRSVKQIGYTYVTIDLEGYRRGSMNEVLNSNTI